MTKPFTAAEAYHAALEDMKNAQRKALDVIDSGGGNARDVLAAALAEAWQKRVSRGELPSILGDA